MDKNDFDVIVVGGGPGGTSTATFLARKGYRVLLLEKEQFPRFHIGESLLPGAWDIWEALGIVEKLETASFPIKQGVNFALFNAPQDILLLTGEYPQYFPRPYAYHVDRARFDEILIRHAESHGVEVRQGWHVKDVLFDGTRATGVTAESMGAHAKSYCFRAPMLVDATGRSCLLAQKLGWRRADPALNKVSYFTHFHGCKNRRESGGTYMTDIHSIAGGWLWYIPLANDVVSVGAVLDSKHDTATKDLQVRFERAIAGSPRIQEWIGSGSQIMPVHVVSNISYLNDCFVGDGFLMVGDAAMFVDPIFSAGVTLAMRSGMFAAAVIEEAFRFGDFSAQRLAPYEARIRHPMHNIFKMIYNWYGLLAKKDMNNIFYKARELPLLRERLIVLLSGGYDKIDMEEILSAAGENHSAAAYPLLRREAAVKASTSGIQRLKAPMVN